MKFLLRTAVAALGLVIAAYLVPGVFIEGTLTVFLAALILGLLNLVVRPVLVILTLPITILTLGLFIFVINALLFWLAAAFLQDFAVSGFFAALVGSILVSIVSLIGNRFIE